MSDLIKYSVEARTHDLAILNLKSQNLSELSPEALTNKYLEVYTTIFKILEDARLASK